MPERLTFRNFSHQREQGKIALALVGMSNVGKSYWSERLCEDSAFASFGCDDAIEVELSPELQAQGYEGGITDVARWMGQPYDLQFAHTQAQYLRLEAEMTEQALQQDSEGRNRVIDTTGSVVHLDPSIRRRLTNMTTVVYLEATDEMREEMFKKYMECPKPVVWGDIY